MSAQVLIIEDDPGIVDVVSFALQSDGFDVDSAATGQDGLLKAAAEAQDLIVLDVNLPDLSGLEVCRRLRGVSSVPIVMLTVRDTELDKVMGLEFGADDYITKPFSIVELTSRIRALLRRRDLDRNDHEPLRKTHGRLSIDYHRHEVTVEGSVVDLTPSEFRILSLLTETPGRVYTREQIMGSLWDVPFEGSRRACDVHVYHLRRKIERDPANPECLLTVRGVGYRFEIPPPEREMDPEPRE